MVNKIYALIGPFASGRRTLAMQLSRIGVHYIPTYTTKPTDAKDTHPGLFRTLPQEEFDKLFPPKEKGWQPSQEEFYIHSHSSING